jgi:hypothetical protein
VRVACAFVGACSGGAVHTVIGGRRHLGGLLVRKESFYKVGHVVTAGGAIDGREDTDEGCTLRETAWRGWRRRWKANIYWRTDVEGV